jgi:hypothetical protein
MGTHKRYPYDYDDPVKMVRHYNEFVCFDVRISGGQIIPYVLDHLSRIIQPHFPINNIPEQAFPVLCADSHEIRPGL